MLLAALEVLLVHGGRALDVDVALAEVRPLQLEAKAERGGEQAALVAERGLLSQIAGVDLKE